MLETLPTIPTAVDATDPAVMLLAWLLTALVKRAEPWLEKLGLAPAFLRASLPAIAVLMAVAIRASIVAVQGEPFSWDVLLRALAAGAMAVMVHSQVREVKKAPGRRRKGKSDTKGTP